MQRSVRMLPTSSCNFYSPSSASHLRASPLVSCLWRSLALYRNQSENLMSISSLPLSSSSSSLSGACLRKATCVQRLGRSFERVLRLKKGSSNPQVVRCRAGASSPASVPVSTSSSSASIPSSYEQELLEDLQSKSSAKFASGFGPALGKTSLERSFTVSTCSCLYDPSKLINAAPFAAASANHSTFSEQGTPFSDRVQQFQKLNWKGKAGIMMTFVLLGCAAAGAYIVGKKRWSQFQEKNAGGGGGSDSPMNIVARGATTVQSNLGPWSFQDLILGLAAMAKVTEKAPPKPPGQPAKDFAQNPRFLERAQHWRAMAEAVYVFDPASFSLQTHLPESAIVAAQWTPDQNSLRPAYAVCVDAPYGAVVLTVRGTSQVVDMLVNAGASAESFMNGQGHGGFVHATEKLVEEVVPHLHKAFEEQGKLQKNLKLVIVGHSMGAAVGIMAGLKLKDQFKNIECWGYSTPACLTLDMARDCSSFVTSFLSNHDIVPRFSLVSVELLRQRICNFDWDKAEEIAQGDEDWQYIKSAAESMKKFQQTQDRVSESFQQAQDDVSIQVKNVQDKVGYTPKPESEKGDEEEQEEEKEEKQEHPPLYPPGRLLVLAADPPGCGKMPEQRSNVPQQRNIGTYPSFDEAKNVSWVLHEAKQEDLAEIVVSPWCVSDHMLGNLSEGINYLQRHCDPACTTA